MTVHIDTTDRVGQIDATLYGAVLVEHMQAERALWEREHTPGGVMAGGVRIADVIADTRAQAFADVLEILSGIPAEAHRDRALERIITERDLALGHVAKCRAILERMRR